MSGMALLILALLQRIFLMSSLMLLIFWLIFFFFQAEDGIRDGTVTGVQTCALPIYDLVLLRAAVEDDELVVPGADADAAGSGHEGSVGGRCEAERELVEARALVLGQRSEERRVGKECRSRGSPEH